MPLFENLDSPRVLEKSECLFCGIILSKTVLTAECTIYKIFQDKLSLLIFTIVP